VGRCNAKLSTLVGKCTTVRLLRFGTGELKFNISSAESLSGKIICVSTSVRAGGAWQTVRLSRNVVTIQLP
jgi:hypothetical protein